MSAARSAAARYHVGGFDRALASKRASPFGLACAHRAALTDTKMPLCRGSGQRGIPLLGRKRSATLPVPHPPHIACPVHDRRYRYIAALRSPAHFAPKKRWVKVAMKLISMKRPMAVSPAAKTQHTYRHTVIGTLLKAQIEVQGVATGQRVQERLQGWWRWGM
jgi:hypothetical protein